MNCCLFNGVVRQRKEEKSERVKLKNTAITATYDNSSYLQLSLAISRQLQLSPDNVKNNFRKYDDFIENNK